LHNYKQDQHANLISLISRISNANSVSFGDKDSVFLVKTTHNIDKNVIIGKLQKNFFSVDFINKVGENVNAFPVLQNTGDEFKDAQLYEQEKNKWVKEHPEEYKKMVENTKQQH
jgi:hypothetical protein